MTNRPNVARENDFQLAFGGSKFNLTLQGAPMSIIAAVWESDASILIAAESGAIEVMGGMRTAYHPLLQQHTTASLAWGAIGNAARYLDGWLREYPWPPKSWNAFERAVEERIAGLNGRRRELAKIAGVEVREQELCAVLVAGWIEQEGRIFEVDDRGVLYITDQTQQFRAIGSGALHATIIHEAYKRLQIQDPEVVKLQVGLHIAALAAPGCEPPINILRITPNGVEKIKRPGRKRGR